MLRTAATYKKSGSSNDRWIYFMAALRVFAINVEPEIANFFLGVPFEQHAAVLRRTELSVERT